MNVSGKLFMCLVLSLALAGAWRPAAAQGFKWWQHERFQRELGLTSEQTARLEEVFQALQPTLKTQKETLDRLEAKLSKVINDPRSDETAVLVALERTEAARAELSRSRTLMSFRMRRILTDDQNVKMKALHDEWVRERRSRSNQTPRDRRDR